MPGNGTILGQVMTIHAGAITAVDSLLMPIGKIQEVAGTPWDFQKGKMIGTDIKATGGDPIGYDYNFVLDGNVFLRNQVVRFHAPEESHRQRG